MVVQPSTLLLRPGSPAPTFRLPDASTGRIVAIDDFRAAKVLLVVFLCNHCPYVQHVRAKLAELAKAYQTRGVAVVGISSNDVEAYPDDAPEAMREEAKRMGYTFPYLFDATQEVAKAYRAACTPDFFLFDAQRKLAYRGQMDDSRPSNGKPVTGADLTRAVDLVLQGKPVPEPHAPSAGCNIKWKPGQAPDYFHP